MSMKLSIITVNLNDKKGLDATITSVINQTFQQFEYIVVDGLSNDGSLSLLESCLRINNWISEKDKGVYDAMNKGINMASGEYLLFLNSGDFLNTEHTLKNIVPHLLNTDIIYGDLIFDDQKHPHVYRYPDKLTVEFLFEASLGHPATFIRRDLFKQFGNYDTNYKIISDWVFFLRCILKECATTKHIDQIISVFDTNGMSSDPNNSNKITNERFHFLSNEFPLFYEEHLTHKANKQALSRVKSSKGFRLLKKLGVKKFQ